MNWYKKSATNLNELKKQLDDLLEEYSALNMLIIREVATPEQIQKEKEVEQQANYIEKLYKAEYERLKPRAMQAIEEGRPHEVPQQHFIDYHKTGRIPDDAYKGYETTEGISWLGTKEKYPIFLKKQKFGDEEIEFRQSDKKTFYTKTDENKDIVRDNEGNVTYLSPEEIKAKGLPETDTSIVVFNEAGQPIGLASNEFGTDGVWVVKEYQGKGIGTDLLYEFRKQFPSKRKIGQMTSSGIDITKAYHKRLIQEALKNKQHVPQEVLDDYELV